MFKTTTAITKKTIDLMSRINPDLELFCTVAFPTGLNINRHTGFIITPAKFHDERWDTDISYKIKNNEALTEIELKYIWDRILFRTVQTCYNTFAIPFKDETYIQHLFALMILSIGYYGNTNLEYYHNVIKDIMHFISAELSELTEIKAISMILYMPQNMRIKKCLAACKLVSCSMKTANHSANYSVNQSCLTKHSMNVSDNMVAYAPVNSTRRQTK